MLIAWMLRMKENGPISIPTKHMEFAKGDSPRINVSQIANEYDILNE